MDHSTPPNPLNQSHHEWLLDPSSGLYWNSIHGVWAKYQAGKWSYADQDGNPVDGSSLLPGSASVAAPTLSPHRRRERVVYEDVYEGEEGEVAQCTGDRAARPPPSEEGEQEDGELSSIDDSLDPRHPIPAPASAPAPPRPHPLRLLLLPHSRTTALEPTRTLLVLEPSRDEPMVVGRDRTFGPALRLREMEVSKTHATIFWHAPDDSHSHGWFIVDNASTHGTFVGPSRDKGGMAPERLAEPKKASKPFRLSHLDTISIASATEPIIAFEVHLHPRFPSSCQSCALLPDESNRISLESPATAPAPPGPSEPREEEVYSMSPAEVKAGRERRRKQEMARLRTQFFGGDQAAGGKRPKKRERAEAEADEPGPRAAQYVDRAKLRRQTHGRPAVAPTEASPSAPAEPEQPMARGAAMLAKLAGGTEGVGKMGKVVEAKTMGSRQAGLGSREMVVGVEKVGGPKDWREETRAASYRRYGAM